MDAAVLATEDAQTVLREAHHFLAGDPVGHNLILTLLHDRKIHGGPGRYWVVSLDGTPAGVVFQSPLTFVAALTPMPRAAIPAAVEAVASAAEDSGVTIPGIMAEAATAAAFAGLWSERGRCAAVPGQGQRLYEAFDLSPPTGVPGSFRQALPSDRHRLTSWMKAFQADIGEVAGDPEQAVDRFLRAGRFWIWYDRGPVSMAARSAAVEQVSRIQAVYTPPEHRGHGYARACTAALTSQAQALGERCILYADLGHPTSNSVYRSIGYRAVSEVLKYRFDPPTTAAAVITPPR
jgi:GNAT superfamily N-acetyltransferase